MRESRERPAGAEIHPTAVVHAGARIEDGVTVAPYAVIGADVTIGAGTRIGPHVVIENGVRLGRDNEISAGAVLGCVPQDRHFAGEESYVVIGDRNHIREYTNISRATGEGRATIIGDESYIMAFVHIAHNCRIGNRAILVNCCQLAGHVEVDDDAYVGGLVGIHQFVHVGRLAMVGGYSAVRQDCPPFMLVEGRPARARGLNRVGMRRKGFSGEDQVALRRAFRLLYESGLTMGRAAESIAGELGHLSAVQELLGFLRASVHRRRGVVRWAGNAGADGERDDYDE